MIPAENPKRLLKPAAQKARTWREILAADEAMHQQRSNVGGILLSRPHGGFRLAKQTDWGDEYVAFAYDLQEAWKKLAQITGREVSELKRLALTQVQ